MTPLFFLTEPGAITTMKAASPPFLSLVGFIKEGNHLDEKETKHACALLEGIKPQNQNGFTSEDVLFKLVPSSDGSCSGFTESIIPLLTSSNEELLNSTLSLLNHIVFLVAPTSFFDFLATGFFTLLPQTFYQQKMLLLAKSSFYMVSIMCNILICSDPRIIPQICKDRQISMDTFKETFLDNFFHPIEPFLEFIYANLRRIPDSIKSIHFPKFLGKIVQCSPFLEQMTQYALSSSPLALTCINYLEFFETDALRNRLLLEMNDGLTHLKIANPAIQKRGQRVVVKLCEDGFSDEMEAHFRCEEYDFGHQYCSSLGKWVIDELGGNLFPKRGKKK
ncbi:hypothetical protein BLNAU_20337 [Blattamonas nauphoetae]|uniref:Uncharacterized protein n=1 Tax=Blattamonas nauphoetae TaxID=2049346 RepID=A0ABQ9WZ16_9EUKA|nr:hypothetical protein BLNAU_20337 [Blattamonas nauphoetae]